MDFLCLFTMFLRNVSFLTALFPDIIESLESKNLRITLEFIFIFFSPLDFRFAKFFSRIFHVCLNSFQGNVCTLSYVLVRRYYLSHRRLLCEQSFNGSQKSYNGEFPPQRVRSVYNFGHRIGGLGPYY